MNALLKEGVNHMTYAWGFGGAREKDKTYFYNDGAKKTSLSY